jgi:hypothetical protein
MFRCDNLFSELQAETHVGLHVKCQFLLLDLKQNWRMLTNVSKSPVSNLIKIHWPLLAAVT